MNPVAHRALKDEWPHLHTGVPFHCFYYDMHKNVQGVSNSVDYQDKYFLKQEIPVLLHQ
jgi:hypothetical protein